MPQILLGPGASALITGAALEALRRDPRHAIGEDGIVCLVCGEVFRHLTNTHLAHHALTSEAFKQSFGYNGRRSLMAHAVRRRHADNAIRRGLAQMIRQRPILADPTIARARGHPDAGTRGVAAPARQWAMVPHTPVARRQRPVRDGRCRHAWTQLVRRQSPSR